MNGCPDNRSRLFNALNVIARTGIGSVGKMITTELELRVRMLVELLGQVCKGCRMPFIPTTLEIDHKDGDGKDDRARFNDNAAQMWAYYLLPEHHDEAKQRLQPLCKNCHDFKSRVAGDYARRVNMPVSASPPTNSVPMHLLLLDDTYQQRMKASLTASLLWYLTRDDGRDIHEERLIALAINRGIFVDDFEARVIIHRATFNVPGTRWHGLFFSTRPGFLQLESRRKYVMTDGKLVPLKRGPLQVSTRGG